MTTQSIADIFDTIYIINLPERVDRKKEMIEQLAKLFPEGIPDNIKFFAAIRPTEPGDFPSIGARGCFLSHLAILKEARDKHLRSIMIMEDDLNFERIMIDNHDAITRKFIQKKWDMAYFGYHLISQEFQADEKADRLDFRVYQGRVRLRTTYFIAFNYTIINNVIAFLEDLLSPKENQDQELGPMHVDGAYAMFRRINTNTLTAVANSNLGYQRSSKSDIADSNVIHKNPFTKKIIQLLRFFRNKINKK